MSRLCAAALTVAVILLAPAGLAATTVTGTVKDAAGNTVTGTIYFRLSQEGIAGGVFYLAPPVSCPVTAGVIGTCSVQGNDTISPAGTVYSVWVRETSTAGARGGRPVLPERTYSITGATWDIGTQTPNPSSVQSGVHGESLHSGDAIPGAAQNFGAFFARWDQIAVPADPPAGSVHFFFNQATGELSVRKSDATTVSLEGGGGGATHQVDGVNLASASPVNFTDVAGHILFSNPSAGVIEGRLPAGASEGQLLIWDQGLSEYVPGDPFVSGITAHDAPGTSTNPVLIGGYASTAAPAAVSLDGDAVRAWLERNGTQVVGLATGGTLYDARQIRALTNTDVVTAEISIFPANQPFNIAQILGAAPAATNPFPGRLTDGTGFYNAPTTAQFPAALVGGRLDVNVGNTPTVTANAGTNLNTSALSLEATQADVRTAAQLIDDIINAPDSALSKVGAIGGQLDDTATATVTENNVGASRITPERSLHVEIRTGANEAGTAGNPLRVDTTGSTIQPISAASLPLPAGAATSANQLPDGHNVDVTDRAARDLGKVDVAAFDVPLPAGSNNLGDVGVASITPVTATGTMTAVSQSVTIDVGGYGSVGIQLSGTWAATVGFDGTVDGTNWQDLQVMPSSSTTAVTTATANGIWYVDVGGLDQVRVFTDLFTSGTLQADLQASVASGKPVVAAGAAGGTSETDDSVFTGGSTAVTPIGAVYDTTPPTITDGNVGAPRMDVNRFLMVNVAAGGAGDGKILDGTAAGEADVIAANPGGTEQGLVTRNIPSGTQAISAASLPLPAGAATSANQLPDGHNVTVDNASITVDQGGVQPNASHTRNEIFSESLAIGGELDDTAPVVATEGNVSPARITAQRGVHVNLRNNAGTELGTASDPVRTDTTGTTTQPISAASLPLPAGAATSANQLADGHSVDVTPAAPVATDYLPARITDGSAFIAPLAEATFTTRINTQGQKAMAASTPVVLASDHSDVPVSQATAANLNMRPDTSGATAAAPPARADYVGGLNSGATGGLLGGLTVCDSFANVDIVTATTTLIVTGVSGRHVRICAFNLLTAGANNVAFLSGTGATCGTGTTGMTGGTTAAEGYNFAANGGIAQGSGLGEINRTNATGDSVCIVTSAAVQLSGRISYAIY